MRKMQKQQGKPLREPEKCNLLGPVAAIFTSANTGSWRLERPSVDFEVCIKCGTCARYCPAGIITIDKEKKEGVCFDWNYCKGCGICANECPKQCITMTAEGGKRE